MSAPARRAVIVDGVRTPFGKGRAGGALGGVHPVDLYAGLLGVLVARQALAPALVDDVITGCVIQVGEQAGNIGRQAVLAAGFPESVPAVTIDRKCGSAQQAIDFAAQGIIAGAADVDIAGGVEMMGTVEAKSNRLGRDSLGPRFHARYPDGLVHQGVSAELIAARYGLSRGEMDAFAARSHALAARAEDDGLWRDTVLPVDDVVRDEGVRRGTSIEALGALKPAFQSPEMAARFPEIDWGVTAGNASQVSDGASALLLMEEGLARRMGFRARAAVTHFAAVGDDPLLMLTGVIPATRKLLARAGLTVADIDSCEINEAFASVVLAWAQATGADLARVNRFGGAIAIGHPVGASGGRLMLNLLCALEVTGGRYGLLSMCESGGMANATLVERLD
ncbi:MAG: thiolase family protein [Sandaracinobacter sp.]